MANVDDLSTDSDLEGWAGDPYPAEIKAAKLARKAKQVTTHTPAKELTRAKRTEREEHKEPATEHKPKGPRPLAR